MSAHTIDDQGLDCALARAAIYRFLADALRHPARGALTACEWHRPVQLALEVAGAGALSPELERCAACARDGARLESEYGRVFGHTPRAGVPLYESEWLGAAGELLQYHQMADLAAYYRAFGLTLGGACDERPDHIGIELSFLHYLSVKEAWAAERGDQDLAHVARAAARRFLTEHVAVWTPAFCARLEEAGRGSFYEALARFTSRWLERECARNSVAWGDPTLAPGESSVTLEDTCVSCAHASSCVPGGQMSGAPE
jgi:DMSO reductase family type II enzyme chaperone